MKKLIYIFLLLCLVVGCSSRQSLHYYIHAPDGKVSEVRYYPIYVDKDFGAGDKLEMAAAVEQWNFALNGQVRLAVVDWEFNMSPISLKENAWYILKVDSSCKFKPADTSKERTLAWANKLGGNHVYIIRDRLGNGDIKGITMHEIGHLLGTDHVGEYLMFHYYNRARYNCIDYASAESVGKILKLDVKSLNYCVYESGI